MQKQSVATSGALGGGAIGTLLIFVTGCLGAKALLLLGFSAGVLGGLSGLEPYRPVFVVWSIVGLAVGVWLILRQRRRANSHATQNDTRIGTATWADRD